MRDSEFYKSVSRIIYDIVGADGIFSDRELNLVYQAFNEKYSLQSFTFEQVSDISFGEALSILQQDNYTEYIDDLFKDLCFLSGIDWQYSSDIEHKNDYSKGVEGHCSSEEALILIACYYALKKRVLVFSSSNDELRFAKNEIIYVENYYDETINKDIQEKYDYLTTKLEIYGLRLIYIPQICALMQERNKHGDFLKIVRYINGHHNCSDSDINKLATEGLPNVTTSQFTEDYLGCQENKNGENIYNDLDPSIMLKISTSSVKTKNHQHITKNNFILIPIVNNCIEDVINEVTILYSTFTHDAHLHDFNMIRHKRPFILHGFDKTFINYILNKSFSTDTVSRVIFDFSRPKIKFVFGQDSHKREVQLEFVKPTIIYFIIAFFSHINGIPQSRCMDERLSNAIQEIYSLILDEVNKQGCTIKSTKLYIDNGTIGPSLTRLKHILLQNKIPQSYFVKREDQKYNLVSFEENKLYAITPNQGEFKLFDRYHFFTRHSTRMGLDNYGIYTSFFKNIFNQRNTSSSSPSAM
ncbi:MAG: hypothetical protein IJR06_00625 [Paludibacteraceae bacterium]|nr:hypothetical protein [Paludibacteraceae bacterium]